MRVKRDYSPPVKANRVRILVDGITPRFSYVGIMPDDAAGRVFPGISPFPPALAFRGCPILTSLHPHRLPIPRCTDGAGRRFDIPVLELESTCRRADLLAGDKMAGWRRHLWSLFVTP
ncbi:hypothetical protein PR048_022661 [Dryococelus australis]|uniref:Uncharacterized protein n=1 Tax=Dryococelus australis TaxID=614101 RepID=A0ABQ9H1N5_9NEOP|nr:hypothetical protein PR048_022661 [Dryococelus australis]